MELRTWLIQDSPGRIAQAVSTHADSWALDDGAREALNRNGLRLIRVAPERLDALCADLGGATVNLTAWHGQVLSWRTLIDRPLVSHQHPVAIDGHVQPADADSARLLVRGWTIALEDGSHFQMQLVPQFRRESEPAILPRPNSAPSQGRPISSVRMELMLESGWAYLLTCEAPAVEWTIGEGSRKAPESPPPATASETEGDSGRAFEFGQARARPRSIERTRPLGPEADPAPTIGQLLFVGQNPSPTRGVLIFIAKLPPSLMPRPEHESPPSNPSP